MKAQYTDRHIQVESGNDIFDQGAPRQVVRRDFGGKTVWFKKPPYAGDPRLERLSARISDQLETAFQNSDL